MDELLSSNHASELFEEEATFAAAAQAELSNELFIAGFGACGARDACEQVTITAGIRCPSHGLRRAYAPEGGEVSGVATELA